jgi:hypothetical protein
MNYIFAILAVVLVLSAIGIFYVLTDGFNQRKLYHDSELVGSTTLSSEWRDFGVEGKIVVERDVRMISIKFAEPFNVDIRGGGLERPNGDAINIQIKMVDANGEVVTMPFAGARGNRIVAFRPVEVVPDLKYTTIRARCDSPIEIEAIMWTTFNIKDMK